MQQEFYTSCIKINGIPLLPPLMTDGIKEEMRRYKSLAIKVEEKLKSRQLVICAEDKCVQANIIASEDTLKSTKYSSDSDISNHNTTSDNTYNSDSFSKMTIVEHVQKSQTTRKTRNERNIQSSVSDMQLYDSINDLSSVNGTSQNEYVNKEMETAATDEDVTESCKPETPKTLDVVPLMLNQKADDIQSFTTASKENENLPKLSRQGSYVLDTPSPCLLAHMDMDLIDKDYIPTSTIDTPQRTQWNTMSPKVEWQNKRLAMENARDTSNTTECELTSRCVETNISPQTSQSNSIIGTKHLAEESDAQLKHNQMSDVDLEKQDLLEKSKRDNGVYISSLATESQEFTKDTCSSETQLSRTDENKWNYINGIENNKEHQDLIVKTKSSTIPEQLLTVYKQIEEMHRKQILELISRQRKEQSLLQAEFQKQQMILLDEIQKCSLGTPRRVDASNATSNQLSSNETRLENGETREQSNANFHDNLHGEAHHNNELSSANGTNIVCALDYISPKNFHLLKSHTSPLITDVSLATFNVVRKIDSCDVIRNNNNINNYDSNYESYDDRRIRKNLNVNRQLFPLDSNTMQVPVPNTSAYLDEHIRAVIIINAYARGYLVRRLMRTERVITLKKTYKEALQCMLKLHVDAPLNLAEVNFLHRLQLQCDAASMNLVELFAQSPAKKMKVISQDREIKQSRAERPSSSYSYSFATQKTLARKNLKEFESTMTKYQRPILVIRKDIVRSRCQTWSDIREKLMSPNMHQGIRRSTSAGTVRKPWR